MEINLLSVDQAFKVPFDVFHNNFSYYLYDGGSHINTAPFIALGKVLDSPYLRMN